MRMSTNESNTEFLSIIILHLIIFPLSRTVGLLGMSGKGRCDLSEKLPGIWSFLFPNIRLDIDIDSLSVSSSQINGTNSKSNMWI